MAQGDITKEYENDKIEIVQTWAIQVRKATKKVLTRTHNRHVLQPFNSVKDNDNKWTHTATVISGEDADVQAIANTVWTDDVKTAYKTFKESQTV